MQGSGTDSGCCLSFPVCNVAADVPPKSVGARPYFVILAPLTRGVQLNADPAAAHGPMTTPAGPPRSSSIR